MKKIHITLYIVAFGLVSGNAVQKNLAVASDILRSEKAMPKKKMYGTNVYRQGQDIYALDANQCTELLQRQTNHHHRYSSIAQGDGQSIKPADGDQMNLLGDFTQLILEPSPATKNQTKTTKTTDTITNATTTTITENVAIETQNNFSVASSSPINLVIDHRNGLVVINSQVTNSFDLRQLLESCQAAKR